MNEFGHALRRWRRLRGMKQSHAAELLGITQATVSRWELGRHRPTQAEARRLSALLQAPLDSSGDAALRRLVETSALSVHLICDLSHRLLAASPRRFIEWHSSPAELRGVSLWGFATDEIRTSEANLGDLGWYEDGQSSVRFWTDTNHREVVHIKPGYLLWERLQLSDGTLARLVTSAG